MDTLSSSVSTLKAPSFRDLSHYKTPSTPRLIPHNSRKSSTNTNSRRNSISNSCTSTFALGRTSLSSSSHAALPHKQPQPSQVVHKNPASGYAAALIDIAKVKNSLEDVHNDVRRFKRILRNDQVRCILMDAYVGVKEKGDIVKEVAVKGRFHRYLVAVVKMLVEKGKVDMVGEVLGEFERIYDELCGTQVVLVASAKKMEENQLFGIAKRVQWLSGAFKVKVRNLVDDNLPAFAV